MFFYEPIIRKLMKNFIDIYILENLVADLER